MIPKHKTTLKVAIISAIGLSVALFAHSKTSTTQANDDNNKVVEKSSLMPPQVLTGNVTKTLEQFSLTTEQGTQYHVYDPDAILDKLAQQRINQDGLYELDNVKVKAILSDVGNYGHMGYYQHQITIIGLAES